MSETIKDGTGQGFHAKVNSSHQLATFAVTQDIEAWLSQEAHSVYALGIDDAVIPSASVEYPLIWIKNNDPSLPLHFSSMFGSWNGGDTNHNRVAKIRHRFGTGAPSSGYVSQTLRPTFLGSQRPSSVDVWVWDGTTPGGIQLATSGAAAGTVYLAQGFTNFDNHGGSLLDVGQGLLITAIVEETGSLCVGAYVFFDMEASS